MKKFINNKRGFTLVELLIVIGITGVIISAVGSFLVSNINVFNKANDQIEVQYQLQNAINFVAEKIIETTSIKFWQNENGTLKEYKLSNGNVISLNSSSKKLSFNGVEFSNYIEDIVVEPSDGTELGNSKVVSITIVGKKKEYEDSVSTEVALRNKK